MLSDSNKKKLMISILLVSFSPLLILTVFQTVYFGKILEREAVREVNVVIKENSKAQLEKILNEDQNLKSLNKEMLINLVDRVNGENKSVIEKQAGLKSKDYIPLGIILFILFVLCGVLSLSVSGWIFKEIRQVTKKIKEASSLKEKSLGSGIKETNTIPVKTTTSNEITVHKDKLVSDLIDQRDQLRINLDSASGDMAVFISSVYKKLGKVLKNNGIEPLEDSGRYNSTYQVVAGTKETNDRLLDETIVETFRPGYRLGDTVIRPQEVIIYAYVENR
ncbi:MAG: nucleotide exchange factor GrpE [Clostridia bacterium]|nr:nucleotide exchange factor GrpE [Clostridia bacterium]